MRAVADAGPIIHLSWIGRLDLLTHLFEEIAVPAEVFRELRAPRGWTRGIEEIQAFVTGPGVRFIPAMQVSSRVSLELGAGERAALSLALETPDSILLSDDGDARIEGLRLGLRVSGAVGVLIESRRRGLIPAALPLVLELRELGQWISDQLIELVRATDQAPA